MVKIHTLLLAMPGGMEWVIILLVIFLFIGPKKIGRLLQSAGKKLTGEDQNPR